MTNHISIYGGHNSTISFYSSKLDKFFNIELERITGIRYFHFSGADASFVDKVLKKCLYIANKFWGIDNNFETCTLGYNGSTHDDIIKSIINSKSFSKEHHHDSHAACAYYQSNFNDSLIFSYDGGGDDGSFVIYKSVDNKLEKIKTIEKNIGYVYNLSGYPCREIKGVRGNLYNDLAIAGKLMGLVGYGSAVDEWKNQFHLFYNKSSGWDINELLGSTVGIGVSSFEGKLSYDFAATTQKVFEEQFLEIFNKTIGGNKNVCLTGGCALNVLLNQKLLDGYQDVNFYIPPNPDDGGLSLGQLFNTLIKNSIKFTRPTDINFSGLPILDIEKLESVIELYKAEKVDIKTLAKELSNGKIIGIMQGNSECGPRALGNRSIVCKPSDGMKDTLNKKVKFREWFRPFAPVTTNKHANEYFHVKNYKDSSVGSFEYMSYAPVVQDNKKELIPSIVHSDGSSRLQIVTNKNSLFYQLADSLEEIGETPVFINTSFNIRGKPILTTIDDALDVLEQTELDALYINGWFFKTKINRK